MTSTPSSPADRYRRLATRFTDLVNAVPDDRWSAPSPCDEWTAIDVVKHVVTTEADLLGRMPFAPGTAEDTTDALASWPRVRDLIQAALDNPEHATYTYDGYFGPTTFAATVDQFYSMDLVVHAWDLARAAGLTEFEAIDPTEIDTITEAFAPLAGTMRQPGLFNEEIAVPAEADAQTRFLAFTGRKP